MASSTDNYDGDQSEPSWLDTENDKTHRQEVQPLLFGTGKLTLKDPTPEKALKFGDGHQQQNPNDDNDAIGSNKSKPKPKSYGTTNNRSSLWTIQTALTEPTNTTTNEGDNSVKDSQGLSKEGDDADDYATVITVNNISGRPDRPKREWPVKVFFFIEVYALLTCTLLLISQLLPIIFIPLSEFSFGYFALKIYMCIFSIIFIIVEIDHPFFTFINRAVFLTTFATRGFMYTFFGFICFEEAYSKKVSLKLEASSSIFEVSWYAIANRIAAFSLISLGTLYFLMGIFCLQKIRDKFVYGDRAKRRAYKHAMHTYANPNP